MWRLSWRLSWRLLFRVAVRVWVEWMRLTQCRNQFVDRHRKYILEHGYSLLRMLTASFVVLLFMAVLADPQHVTPQDLDRLRDEIRQEQQFDLDRLGKWLVWVATTMGAVYVIKKRGLEFTRGVWRFVKLTTLVPVHVKELIDGQSSIRGEITILGTRLRMVEDNIEIANFTADIEGRWVSLSEEMAKLAGAYPQKLMGHGWKVRIESVDRERVFGDWMKAVRFGEPFSSEFYFYHPSGERVKVSFIATPQVGAGGQRIGYVGIVKKIRGSGEIEPLPHQSK